MSPFDDVSPAGSIAVGILVGLLSTSIQSLGLTLQRKSHVLEDEKDPHDVRRPPHRRRLWQLGMGMFIISNLVGSTIQITTLPLPVLSTLQASGLVFNSICATLILGEPFTRWSLGGTVLVSSGAVLIAIFGAIPEPAHTLDQLLELLGRHAFITWMICQAFLVAVVIAIAACLARIPSLSSQPRIRLIRGLAYGCISGILSAHSLLVAKSAVELVVRTIVDRVNQFNRWQSWVIVLGLVTLALVQLYYLHCGLKLVSTSVLYPLVFCIYNIIAILDGLIYFRQTDRLTTLHAALIAVGTVILLSGVLALSWRLSDEQSQPPLTQSALAPGLGLVEETDDEECSEESQEDEEALLEPLTPATPTTKLDAILGATRTARKGSVFVSEADEIWDVLSDRDPPNQNPTSPSLSSRRASANLPHMRKSSLQFAPTERSPLLRSETNISTPRNRRRRRSTGFRGFMPRPAPRTARRSMRNASYPGLLGNDEQPSPSDLQQAEDDGITARQFWRLPWWRWNRRRRTMSTSNVSRRDLNGGNIAHGYESISVPGQPGPSTSPTGTV